jgi:beta-lactamase class A
MAYALVLLSSLSFACARTNSGAASSGALSKPPETNRTPADDTKIKEIAATANGHVGIFAVVLETNQTVSVNPQDHFPMQSVYKLPICMAVLQHVDAGKLKLDRKVRVGKSDFIGPNAHSPVRDRFPNGVELTVSELIRFAIAESDGTASDVLMRLAGGPTAIQAYLRSLNIKDIIIVNSEKELSQKPDIQYDNWATPEASVALLRVLQEKRGLSDSSQALVLKYMIESTPGPKRLKGLLPPETIVAHKTGTSGTQNGVTAATNDIGIITLPNGQHLAIAVFVSDSRESEATREGVIAKTAKTVFDSVGSSK